MIHARRGKRHKKGNAMKKKIALIERRVEKIKRELAALGDMRPGSLSVQTRKWGGEYCQLSYTHRGKGHTEYVPQARRKKVERQLATYQKFRKLTQEWIDLEIEFCKLKIDVEEEIA
jgi:uncharacterized protein YicC (UPF0701 family)